MQINAQFIAGIVNGELIGQPDTIVSKVDKIEEAQSGSLTFVANPKYTNYLSQTQASVILISKDLMPTTPRPDITYLVVEDAYASFTVLLQKYQQLVGSGLKSGIESPNFIHPSAKIGENVYIGAFTYIGENAVIGDHSQIYPNSYIGDHVTIGTLCTLFAGVKVYHHCQIGDHTIIHAGTVIGSDGFGFAPQKDGSYAKVPQLGNVVVGKNVEIGANACIDRATLGSTIIEDGVKLDNLIQIAHNVKIGQHTAIAAQAGVSGSTIIGKHCLIGGQVGIVGHIQLADNTKVNAQSGVSKSVKEEGQALTGSPAYEYKNALKSQAIFRNLPYLQDRLQKLEQELLHLKSSKED
jgi:UDP-3-O-[3-hydroxymyristoyl] glucosamine N-acyltransferase